MTDKMLIYLHVNVVFMHSHPAQNKGIISDENLKWRGNRLLRNKLEWYHHK